MDVQNTCGCIGIIGAMEIEVNSIVSAMEDCQTLCEGHLKFYKGRISGKDCVIACCGEGKVNSAICTQTMLLRFHPRCVINIGVAGGIGDGIEIGDLVLASAVVQHDFDVTGLGYPKGEIPLLKTVELPADAELTETILKCARKVYHGGIYTGVVASGDQFICRLEDFQRIRKEFGALACEMEGASIGHVCALNGTPFAVIRAISDGGNHDSPVDFPRFAKETAEKTQTLMQAVLKDL